MNRYYGQLRSLAESVPRRRGDEPATVGMYDASVGLFPAGAGMNREFGLLGLQINAVPRRRGDEPNFTNCVERLINCSPQARG